jgi:hypothetical protein
MRLSTFVQKPQGHFMTALVVMTLILLSACASARLLPWKPVDTASLEKTEAYSKELNTIRFVTVGPEAEQIYGYFLYRDGIEVVTGGGAYVVNMGKLTLVEVRADYDRVRKSKMYSAGSGLIVREILLGSSVAGYTAADDNIDVGIWDITPAGKDQGTVLQMVYNDSRGQHDGGSYRGRSHSGD